MGAYVVTGQRARQMRVVPAEVLKPRKTWADPTAYDREAAKLAQMFAENFKAFGASVTPEVRAAGPNP